MWIGDSVTAKSRLEVISTLGALAVKTERVKIGTAVLLAAMRNPVVLAQALASVDVLCRGRLVVGVGVSRNDKMFEEEYTACGVPFNQKAGRLSQVLKIMKMLWAGDDVTHENKYYTIENLSLLPKPVQRPGVPLWVSSNDVDSGLKRAALYGDAWITNIPSLQVFKESQKKLEDYASGAGRNPDDIHRCLYLTIHMDPDADKARREGGRVPGGLLPQDLRGGVRAARGQGRRHQRGRGLHQRVRRSRDPDLHRPVSPPRTSSSILTCATSTSCRTSGKGT